MQDVNCRSVYAVITNDVEDSYFAGAAILTDHCLQQTPRLGRNKSFWT
jgi:hypothetical protein